MPDFQPFYFRKDKNFNTCEFVKRNSSGGSLKCYHWFWIWHFYRNFTFKTQRDKILKGPMNFMIAKS